MKKLERALNRDEVLSNFVAGTLVVLEAATDTVTEQVQMKVLFRMTDDPSTAEVAA